MEDARYNNREIDHYLRDMKTQLDRIEAQTIKTNGRTNANELEINRINTRINTAIWAFGITLPVILSLCAIVFYAEIQAVRDAVPKAVSQTLDNYQFEIIE